MWDIQAPPATRTLACFPLLTTRDDDPRPGQSRHTSSVKSPATSLRSPDCLTLRGVVPRRLCALSHTQRFSHLHFRLQLRGNAPYDVAMLTRLDPCVQFGMFGMVVSKDPSPVAGLRIIEPFQVTDWQLRTHPPRSAFGGSGTRPPR